MNPGSILRPQRRPRTAARRLSLETVGGLASIGELPGLGMPEHEATRGVLVSGALSALLHLLVIGGIAIIGYLAKEAVVEIIPVTILSQPVELPGSNEPRPLPVPKMLSAPMASAVPLAIDLANLSAVPAPMIEAPNLDLAVPKAIDLATVTSQPLASQIEMAATPSAADISDVQPMEISPADLTAPRLDLSGPSQAAARTAVDLTAPQSFRNLANIDTSKYTGAITAVPIAGVVVNATGPYTATGISANFLAAGVVGGDPNAVGTVDCLQSAYVHRYWADIQVRMERIWLLPMDSDPEDSVQIKLAVDHAGVVVHLEVVTSTNDEFGASVEKAIREASPFPALTDATRCLTEKTLILTFTNPEKS